VLSGGRTLRQGYEVAQQRAATNKRFSPYGSWPDAMLLLLLHAATEIPAVSLPGASETGPAPASASTMGHGRFDLGTGIIPWVEVEWCPAHRAVSEPSRCALRPVR